MRLKKVQFQVGAAVVECNRKYCDLCKHCCYAGKYDGKHVYSCTLFQTSLDDGGRGTYRSIKCTNAENAAKAATP